MEQAQAIQDVGKAEGDDDAGGDGILEYGLLLAAIGASAHARQQIKPLFLLRLAVFKQTHGVCATFAQTKHPGKPFLGNYSLYPGEKALKTRYFQLFARNC